MEFIVADEALRKSMLLAEKQAATIKRLKHLMRPAQPIRLEINGEIHSVPIGVSRSDYLNAVGTVGKP